MTRILLSALLLGAMSLAVAQESNDSQNQSLLEKRNSIKFQKLLDERIKTLEKNIPDMEPTAPAPPVSGVWVIAVESTEGGWETIEDGAMVTVNDHGGSKFYAYTYVKGYGGFRDHANFAGNDAVPEGGPIPVDEDGDGVTDGWGQKWDISKPPNDSGIFVFIANSINAGPSLSTSLRIR